MQASSALRARAAATAAPALPAPLPACSRPRCRRAAPASPSPSAAPWRRRRPPLLLPLAAAAAAPAPGPDDAPSSQDDTPLQQPPPEERKEYYDPREMPPLPLTVSRISVPELEHVVVDPATESQRLASLAVFTEMWRDEQYGGRLNRRSAITALCMYDRDDVAAARVKPGAYPNIDLLERVYREGLDVEVVVEEK
jgi:hypothetical protein